MPAASRSDSASSAGTVRVTMRNKTSRFGRTASRGAKQPGRSMAKGCSPANRSPAAAALARAGRAARRRLTLRYCSIKAVVHCSMTGARRAACEFGVQAKRG